MPTALASQKKSNLEIIKEAFEKLSDPFGKGLENIRLGGALLGRASYGETGQGDLLTYQAAYKVIEGMVREGTSRVDAAAIELVLKALHADLGYFDEGNRGFHGTILRNVFEAMEYAPPARSRSQQL